MMSEFDACQCVNGQGLHDDILAAGELSCFCEDTCVHDHSSCNCIDAFAEGGAAIESSARSISSRGAKVERESGKVRCSADHESRSNAQVRARASPQVNEVPKVMPMAQALKQQLHQCALQTARMCTTDCI